MQKVTNNMRKEFRALKESIDKIWRFNVENIVKILKSIYLYRDIFRE